MARPNNAPMGAGFKKMNKDGLIRLLVDEMQENRKLQEENKKLKKILNRIKELYEDEDEAELLNY